MELSLQLGAAGDAGPRATEGARVLVGVAMLRPGGQ